MSGGFIKAKAATMKETLHGAAHGSSRSATLVRGFLDEVVKSKSFVLASDRQTDAT